MSDLSTVRVLRSRPSRQLIGARVGLLGAILESLVGQSEQRTRLIARKEHRYTRLHFRLFSVVTNQCGVVESIHNLRIRMLTRIDHAGVVAVRRASPMRVVTLPQPRNTTVPAPRKT